MAAVKYVLPSGLGDLNARDKDGCTAILLAVKEGREEVVRALLGANADASIANR
jgi:ankyrin repeat protein